MKYLKYFEGLIFGGRQSKKRSDKYELGEIVWVKCKCKKNGMDIDINEPMKIIHIRDSHDRETNKTTYEYGVGFLNNKNDLADVAVDEKNIRKAKDYEINAHKYNL